MDECPSSSRSSSRSYSCLILGCRFSQLNGFCFRALVLYVQANFLVVEGFVEFLSSSREKLLLVSFRLSHMEFFQRLHNMELHSTIQDFEIQEHTSTQTHFPYLVTAPNGNCSSVLRDQGWLGFHFQFIEFDCEFGEGRRL